MHSALESLEFNVDDLGNILLGQWIEEYLFVHSVDELRWECLPDSFFEDTLSVGLDVPTCGVEADSGSI